MSACTQIRRACCPHVLIYLPRSFPRAGRSPLHEIPFHTEITVDGQGQSGIGGGSCVCENIRARPSSSARTRSEREGVSDTSVSFLKILIVDDHQIVRRRLRTLLSSS